MLSLTLYTCVIGLLAAVMAFTSLPKSPPFWIFFPWILVFAPIWTGLISYWNPPIGPQVLFFVISHLIMISAGYSFVALSRRKTGIPRVALIRRPGQVEYEFSRIRNLVDTLVVFGVIGSVLFIFDAVFVSGFANADSAIDRRLAFIQGEANFFSRIAPMLSWGGYAGLIALIWFGPSILKRRTKYYMGSIILLASFSYLSAGRQVIFMIFLFSLIGWLILRRPFGRIRISLRKTLQISLFLAVMALFLWYMFVLASERNSSAIEDISGYLLFIFGAELNNSFSALLNGVPEDIRSSYVGTLLYFSSQLSTLSAFVTPEASETWGIGFGGIQFPWIYRRIDFIGLDSIEQFMGIRRGYLSTNGYMAVAWSTALGTFLNDFGFIGSYVYSFSVGIFGGVIFSMYRRRPSYFSFGLLAASYVYLFYLILVPASSDTTFFFFVLAFLFLERRYVRLDHGEVRFRTFRFKTGG